MEARAMVKTEKYLTIFNLAIIHSLRNYKALIGLSLFLIACLVIFAHLWKIAAMKTGMVDLHPDQLLWYIALNEWVLIALPDVQEDMEHDLRSGRLAYLLPRPLSYLCATFFEGLGILCVNLWVLGCVAFAFTWIRIGDVPFGVSAFPLIFVLGLLSGCVGLVFKMLVGVSAFWLRQVEPFHWIWEKLLFTFGGLMLPLAVYPPWLQKIAHFTPFPAILGERSALAIHFIFQDVLSVTTTLLFWGLLGLSCLVLLYRKGLSVLSVEGG
jgi:ABC-2 type transport system permease protein